MNQKASAGIFIIIGILFLVFLGFIYYMGFFGTKKTSPPAGGYQTLSEDPKYREVKEKYNLSEEQLQILSTVNPEDNE